MISIKPIGKAIKRLLIKNNFSYQDLANKSGVSKPYIAEIISKNIVPSKEKIENIAKAFNINPFYFKEYRLIKLDEYIDKNPNILIYDNEKDLISFIDVATTMKKVEENQKIMTGQINKQKGDLKIFAELGEIAEKHKKQIDNIKKTLSDNKLIFKILAEITSEVNPNKIDDNDIKLVGDILKKLSEKSSKK